MYGHYYSHNKVYTINVFFCMSVFVLALLINRSVCTFIFFVKSAFCVSIIDVTHLKFLFKILLYSEFVKEVKF